MRAAVDLMEGFTLRPLTLNDARELAAAYRRNTAHLAPWEPRRTDRFFTEAGQEEDLAIRLAASAAGTGYSLGLLHGPRIVGGSTWRGSSVVRSRAEGSATGSIATSRGGDWRRLR